MLHMLCQSSRSCQDSARSTHAHPQSHCYRLQAQTVTRSWRPQSKRPPNPTLACIPPPPLSRHTHQTQCSTAPWGQHPCPCVPTALKCPLFLKPTPRLLPTMACTIHQVATRRRNLRGIPHTHGYPLLVPVRVSRPQQAHSQVSRARCSSFNFCQCKSSLQQPQCRLKLFVQAKQLSIW